MKVAMLSAGVGFGYLWLLWAVLLAAGLRRVMKGGPQVSRMAAGLLVAAGVVALFGILPDVPYYCDVEFCGWLCYVI